jgi:hypothetical protein
LPGDGLLSTSYTSLPMLNMLPNFRTAFPH